jgi:hypothetical protein
MPLMAVFPGGELVNIPTPTSEDSNYFERKMETKAAGDEWEAMTTEDREVFERKLLRKLDWRLIPWPALLYLMSFLDRTNIGNAKVQGVSSQSMLH